MKAVCIKCSSLSLPLCHIVPRHLISTEYKSLPPSYPDLSVEEGLKIEKGNIEQRKKCLDRYKRGLDKVLELHKEEMEAKGGYIIIVGHGATHDFVSDALTSGFPPELHSPYTAPHCSVTNISYNHTRKAWDLNEFAKNIIGS